MAKPSVDDKAVIPASAALTPHDGNGDAMTAPYPALTPVITLARFSNFTHQSVDPATQKPKVDMTDRLVWAVVYNDVPASLLPSHGPSQRPATSATGIYVRLVDASTGLDLEEFSTGLHLAPSALGD